MIQPKLDVNNEANVGHKIPVNEPGKNEKIKKKFLIFTHMFVSVKNALYNNNATSALKCLEEDDDVKGPRLRTPKSFNANKKLTMYDLIYEKTAYRFQGRKRKIEK